MRVLIIVFSCWLTLNSNAQTTDECKFLTALAYMRTNEKFNSLLKEYLPLNKVERKTKYVEFNVSSLVEFVEITEFKNKINYDSVPVERTVFTDDRLFYSKYHFEPFKSDFLEALFEKSQARYTLTFSIPIGNILLVEVLNYENLANRARRFGTGVKILFVFDTRGVIASADLNTIVYN